MTDDFNERKSFAVVITAVIISLAMMLGGAISGLVLSSRAHRDRRTDEGRIMAERLLIDAADSLVHVTSALRLCVEEEPAEALNRTALVHAVRAETALECHTEDWADSRDKEAFLNDLATVLHSSPERSMELSDKLYDYSVKFYKSVSEGQSFEYDGSLVEKEDTETGEVTEEDKKAAQKLVQEALGAEKVEYLGEWGGHIEFNIARGGRSGYAVVCGKKIVEFAFIRGEESETDKQEAERIALETAAACGYKELSVKWSEVTGKSVSVVMCKSFNGALAADDCATAVVFGGEVAAFSAGGCDCEHGDLPPVKKSEREASREAVGGGKGMLVVHTIDGKDRVCYEYRYELEDGVHYVYVCAETGKQIQVTAQ